MKARQLFLFTVLWCASLVATRAEDIDIFITPPTTAVNPNVLIIVDNTANWNQSFASEMAALASVVAGLTDKVNVGLMMFTETGGGNGNPDGAYVRYAIRQMTTANKADLVDLVQNLHKLNDKGNGAKFSLASLEAYLYFKGETAYAGHNKVKKDPAAFVGNSNVYKAPVSDACQKNFVIFISNGPAGDNMADGTTSSNKLKDYNGGVMPSVITLNPNQEQSNWSDEWARFKAGSDVSPLAGSQNIITYAVDVVNTNNETLSWQSHSALLKSMAKHGKGKYFKITNAQENAATTNAIVAALNAIFQEIQAVDSVFAASTLPVSVNVRGTYLNQVYMGVFRPDAQASPRWYGNLKHYKLAVDGAGELYLADVNDLPIENAATGFVNPNVTSLWTTAGAPPGFWGFAYPAAPYDAPDGDKVEKGGAAQKVRTAYATSQAGRKLYTCTGACGPGTTLGAASHTLFSTANTANITQTLLGASSTTERDAIINWVRGADNIDDENGDGSTTDIRASVHGDVLHSRPAVINYNRAGQPADRDIYVFYGGNDGVFRAVKGGADPSDGTEAWGFVAPEFFPKLKRLRDATADPLANRITTSNPKGYFMDGPISVYTHDNNGDDRIDIAIDANDKAYLFATARRGGRFIYAFDVSNPDSPKLLWKKSNADAGYGELGFTWSEPRVAKINWGGSPKTVLIFGGGYDPTVDDLDPDRTYTDISTSTAGNVTTTTTTETRRQLIADNSAAGTVTSQATVTVTTTIIDTGPNPPTVTTSTSTPVTTTTTYSRTMGRILYVVDAENGSVLWSAGRSGSGATLTVPGMDYSIPSDVAIVDTNGNGYIDTFYVGDTGGNIWRGDIGDANSANWTVTQFASLGGSGANKRKFLHKPDVVLSATFPTRTILIGSGDREHPLDTVVTNRFYSLKDSGSMSGITEASLYDATANDVQSTDAATAAAAAAGLAAANGWYITLETGEKVVGAPVTLGAATYFATNTPTSVLPAGQCSNLGEARYYAINYENAGAVYDANANGVFSASERVSGKSIGLPPSPIGISVQINGKTYETVCLGTHCEKPPSVKVGQRYRVYWHLDLDS